MSGCGCPAGAWLTMAPRMNKGRLIMMKRRRLQASAWGAALALVLLAAGCGRSGGGHPNIVLVTIESLRADRIAGAEPTPDPLQNLRRLAEGRGTVRRMVASSSETLPSIVSIFTGVSPARHGTMTTGLDRVPAGLQTLAGRLGAAGYSTAGFPSLTDLGLSSGLSRGFRTYGWPPSDILSGASLAGTDQKGWVADAGRRPGEAVVSDALTWAGRHKTGPFFLWIHLSEAAPPYATDRRLINSFKGSVYDAALAYDDRYVRTLVDGLQALGIMDQTALVIAGDHGESLGENGESLHGLNLYPPALETAVVTVLPGAARPATAPGKGVGRLLDLNASILQLAGLAPDPAGDAAAEEPSLSPGRPLFAATLGPRAAFGWNGVIAWIDGEWAWSGPADEELYRWSDGPGSSRNALSKEAPRAAEMRAKATAAAGNLAQRLAGREALPPGETRMKVIALLRASADEANNNDSAGRKKSLSEALALDPGNFETSALIVAARGTNGVEGTTETARQVEIRGRGMPEALLALARIREVAGALDARKSACASAGEGCVIDLALRMSRMGKNEESAALLAPIAEKSGDADLWRTLGDAYFALQNTFRAGQAFDRAASLRPDDPDILLRQGDCLTTVKDYKGAIAKYQAAQNAQPGLKLAELRLGHIAQAQGDRRGAVEHFRRGLEVDTNTPDGAVVLGRVLAERGMIEEAIPVFLDAASRDMRSGAALYYAAETLGNAGKLDQAEGYLRQSLEREPDNPATLYQLARLLQHRGNGDEAGAMLLRLAKHVQVGIAAQALRDPLFSAAAPGSPVKKALDAVQEAARKQAQAKAQPPDQPPGPKTEAGAPPAAP